MIKVEDLISTLKASGYRITPIRTGILEIFTKSNSPISANDLITSFRNSKKAVNKTTIYRELDFLVWQQLLSEVEFGEGRKRYELNSGHHHHLVCLNCNKIKDVNIKADLSREEKKILEETGFKVQSHNLEFFGLCKNCNR